MYVSVFEVEGSGEFPFDMLRYDHCYPMRSDELGALDIALGYAQEKRGIKKITLVSRCATKHEANQLPTTGRWDSFGWRVVSREVRKY